MNFPKVALLALLTISSAGAFAQDGADHSMKRIFDRLQVLADARDAAAQPVAIAATLDPMPAQSEQPRAQEG